MRTADGGEDHAAPPQRAPVTSRPRRLVASRPRRLATVPGHGPVTAFPSAHPLPSLGPYTCSMARGILAVLSIALTVFALADCVQTKDDEVRGVPKWAWIVLIVLLPWVGPITWLFVGKDRSWGAGGGQPRRKGPIAPDEDPDFLRKLDEDIRRERRERERGQQSPGSAHGSAPEDRRGNPGEADGGEADRGDATGDGDPTTGRDDRSL